MTPTTAATTRVRTVRVVGGVSLRRPRPATLARLPLYGLGLTMLVPFYWMVIGTFKSVGELLRQPPTPVPEHPSLSNFSGHGRVKGLFQQFTNVRFGFWHFFLNSIVVTVAVTAGSLLLASLAAYALTKTRLPWRRALFIVIIASMMVPWPVELIPNFLAVRNLGWLNTYQGYIVPALPKAFVVFFFAQYMRTIPDELAEAARVDGAGDWRIWWHIVLPLLRPALAAMAIFVSLAEWNNFLWPLIIAQSDRMATLPVALARLNSVENSPQTMGVVMAGSLLTTVPTVAVFFAFQRHFTRGIALTGLKG